MVLSSLGTALIFGQPAFLLLALLGPLVWIGQYLFERRQGRTSHSRQVADYESRCAEVEAEAGVALAAERAQRSRDFPDPASLLLTATGPRSNLWERRRHDPDFLALRVGTGTVESNVRVEERAPGDSARVVLRRLVDSPVVVPLLDHGVLGVAGAGELPRALGRWLLGQIVALHSPLDVRVCVLTDPSGQRDWEWVRWLPHARPAIGRDVPAALGNDDASVGRRLEELAALLSARQRAAREAGAGRMPAGQPDVVVVLDGARELRALPGVVQLLREGPAAGIYAVCLDADERRLPAECRALVAEDGWALRVQGAGAPVVHDVRRDVVGPDWSQRLARGLASLRDISDRNEAATLPTAARLLEVLDLEPPAAGAIVARWRRAPASTRAEIGVAADGPFALDLDARGDGPTGWSPGPPGRASPSCCRR
jgi:DNA segregation ATPase FtsK/SpoIIIE, S-DNA-T family